MRTLVSVGVEEFVTREEITLSGMGTDSLLWFYNWGDSAIHASNDHPVIVTIVSYIDWGGEASFERG